MELSESQYELLLELAKSGITDRYSDEIAGRVLVGPEFLAVVEPQLSADMTVARAARARAGDAASKCQADIRIEQLEKVQDFCTLYREVYANG
jgi:hypothetical protein